MNLRILSLAPFLLVTDIAFAKKASEVFESYCSSCHGKALDGAMAPSMLDPKSMRHTSTEALTKIITKGDKSRGMPAWEKGLSAKEIRSLVIYIQEQRDKAVIRPQEEKDLSTDGLPFDLVEIAKADGIFWSMDELPNGGLLATARNGVLHQLKDGELQPVKNSPKGWSHGQGGLLDVRVHPNYKKNGWIYLSLSESADDKKGMTKVIRGRIKKDTWVDEQEIFSVPESYHGKGRVHFGSRIEFQDGYIFFGVGDRGEKELAQDLSKPNGKIYRLHDDGRVPKDNPFVKDKNALPAIWSYGHRNPQGLALDAEGNLWNAEHGPRGGDEINFIQPGVNYGWPVITYGMNYDGTPITERTHHPDMAQPAWYWVPSIAVSDIEYYAGADFPEWQGKFLAAGLRREQLQLLSINDDNSVSFEKVLLNQKGRIRDVQVMKDGSVYLILVNSKKSTIVKVEPKSTNKI